MQLGAEQNECMKSRLHVARQCVTLVLLIIRLDFMTTRPSITLFYPPAYLSFKYMHDYSISRLNARPTQMHASQKNHPLSLNTHKMVNEEDMRKVLAEIESSEAPDYTVIARKYGLMRSTLSRYARGLTTSRAEFQSQIR